MTEPSSEESKAEQPEQPEVEAQPFDAAREGGPTYDVPLPGAETKRAAAGNLTLAAVCHLLGLADGTISIVLAGLLAPLVLWLAMKDQDPEVDFAGKESINFQINLLVWWIAGLILSPCLIGIPVLIALPIAEIVLVILAAIQTVQGQRYRYPFIFRILV